MSDTELYWFNKSLECGLLAAQYPSHSFVHLKYMEQAETYWCFYAAA